MSNRTLSSVNRTGSSTVAAALTILVASGITLLGVVNQMSPEIIVLRASIASLLTFVILISVVSWWRANTPPLEDE